MSRFSLVFTKMHGTGNDYVVLDGFHEPPDDPGALARHLTPRRFGVGADGLLVALPSTKADVRMRMFNVDGSEAEMCGNGLRCLVKFAWERGLLPAARRRAAAAETGPLETDSLETGPLETGTVETGAGVLGWQVEPGPDGRVERVTIDMGRPRLGREAIPMLGAPGPVQDERLEVADRVFDVTALSMGNPHAVTFVPNVEAFPLARLGPLVEMHPSFPNRTNAEFVEIVSRGEVRQRTWERGCGETLACGTGAAAVVVAGVETGRLDREVLVHLRGGDLLVRYASTGHVFQTGPAVEVFEGVWGGAAG